jgi:peptidoglycan/LPS O-acetylase OafA/YrhL
MSFVKPKEASVMPPSPFERGGELRSLTGVRGIAALNVAMAHFDFPAFAAFNGLFFWHNLAVDLFFCLSGFTLALVYERQEQTFANWRLYAAARFARIYPLYLATLLWSALVSFPVGSQYPLERAWTDFLAQLALVNSWPIIGTGVHWDFPAWSISVEFFCYLFIFPLLWRFRPAPKGLAAAAVLFACSLTAYFFFTRYFDWRIYDPKIYQAPNRIAYSVNVVRAVAGFVSGWISYNIYNGGGGLNAICSRYADIITGAMCFIILYGYYNKDILCNNYLLFLFPLFIIGLANGQSATSAFLSKPLVHALGVYSYSIYLVNRPLMSTIDRIIYEYNIALSPISYAAMLIVSLVALSAFIYHFFETPWRNLLRRLLAPSPSRAQRGRTIGWLRDGWFAWPVSTGLLATAVVFAAKVHWAVGPDRELATRYAYFQVFKEGWGAFEGTYIWAIGRNSVIDIHLPATPPATRLIMRGRAFVTVAHPTATTSISVNGSPAAAIQASLEAPSFAQEFDLPGGVTTLRIVLGTDNPASPKSLGLSGDARELSISLESLQVRTIQGEDKAEPVSARETRSQ